MSLKRFIELPDRTDNFKKKKIDEDETTIEEMFELDHDPLDTPTHGARLPVSKTPLIDSLIYCALSICGVEVTSEEDLIFKITNLDLLDATIKRISNQTWFAAETPEGRSNRIKSYKRWFKIAGKPPCSGATKASGELLLVPKSTLLKNKLGKRLNVIKSLLLDHKERGFNIDLCKCTNDNNDNNDNNN